MQYRIDPKSGNRLSVLGYGCMRFENRLGIIDVAAAERLVRRAIEEGVNYFDTAYLYPGSEQALGQILARDGLREKVYVADKLPLMRCRAPEDFDKLLAKQLERLGTDHIDYYLMHNMPTPAAWQALCALGVEDWLRAQQARGVIRQVGFSFHGAAQDFIRLVDAYDWDFTQIQYNYLDEHNQAGRAGLQHAAAKGLPVIIMEPLLGGKLAANLPAEVARVFEAAPVRRSAAAWGLRWLWDQPEVTVVLSGMNSALQLTDNLHTAQDALPGMLTPQEHQAYRDVMEAFAAAFQVRCTGCGYCMPCPQGIDIPGCFSAYNKCAAVSRRAGLQQYIMTSGSLSNQRRFASSCVRCGACEPKCPQGIPIRDKLAEAARVLEPVWLKPGTALAGHVIGMRRRGGENEK